MHEFVILFHEMPAGGKRPSHWDLMLRDDDKLLTWALQGNPMERGQIPGTPLPDHSLKYLHFEGAVDDDRGSVRRVANGRYEWISRLNREAWEIELRPEGSAPLVCRHERGVFIVAWSD